jgi:sugar phosphate isomerase/epimerase
MSMKQNKDIQIGTCMPGTESEKWLPAFLSAGFETLSVNYHMSFSGVDIERQGPELKVMADEKGVRISTLGVYSNPIQLKAHVRRLERAIDAAKLYGADTVATFAGAYEGKPVEESFKRFGEVFRGLCKRARDNGIRIALENCPMDGAWEKATCNIAFNPRAWEVMFNEVPDDNLGLQWEPAHQMVQLIDPIAQLRKWVGKIICLHGKDVTVDQRAVADYGILCNHDWFAPQRTVGFGDCDWRDIISILRMNAFKGDICVEGFHDPVYRDEMELTGQRHALAYLKWCRGDDCPA